MIEIGDSKGNFPLTPHTEMDSKPDSKGLVPPEAKEFAYIIMKQFLLSLSD